MLLLGQSELYSISVHLFQWPQTFLLPQYLYLQSKTHSSMQDGLRDVVQDGLANHVFWALIKLYPMLLHDALHYGRFVGCTKKCHYIVSYFTRPLFINLLSALLDIQAKANSAAHGVFLIQYRGLFLGSTFLLDTI